MRSLLFLLPFHFFFRFRMAVEIKWHRTEKEILTTKRCIDRHTHTHAPKTIVMRRKSSNTSRSFVCCVGLCEKLTLNNTHENEIQCEIYKCASAVCGFDAANCTRVPDFRDISEAYVLWAAVNNSNNSNFQFSRPYFNLLRLHSVMMTFSYLRRKKREYNQKKKTKKTPNPFQMHSFFYAWRATRKSCDQCKNFNQRI